jgi:hypothetical protein
MRQSRLIVGQVVNLRPIGNRPAPGGLELSSDQRAITPVQPAFSRRSVGPPERRLQEPISQSAGHGPAPLHGGAI